MYIGLVVVSDGVCGLPDANNTETLLHELRSYDIACSFLKVGGTYHPEARCLFSVFIM